VVELLPGGLPRPTSVFVAGTNPTLLKWVTLGLLAPYSSRIFWTDIQLAGETFESTDPLGLGLVPADRLQIVHPTDLRREERAGQQAEAAATTVLRTDEHPEAIRRISEFLRLSTHTQELLSASTAIEKAPIIVASNAQRLNSLFPSATIVPTVQAFLEAGASLFMLWAGDPPPRRKVFDVVLHVEGSQPSRWREATLRCEKGISTGPLGSGTPHSVGELSSLAAYLEKSMPSRAMS
jgi:hypothetical protein